MYSSSNDELYTPKILVEPIIKYIPKGSTVWCPCDTKSSEFVLTLKEHDINVIHSHIWEGKDFLTYEPDKHYDYIITNPPFTLKLDIFKRLVSLQKPFAILMNSTCEQYQVMGNYFYELSEKGIYIQKLTPDKKVSFNGKTSSFNTAYFCWNFLPRDNMYCHLENNNSGRHFVPSRMYEDIGLGKGAEDVADLAVSNTRGPHFFNNKDRKIRNLTNSTMKEDLQNV